MSGVDLETYEHLRQVRPQPVLRVLGRRIETRKRTRGINTTDIMGKVMKMKDKRGV